MVYVEFYNRIGDTGFDFVSEGILESFKSLNINWRAYKHHDFQMTALFNEHSINLLKVDTVLLIEDCFFYVEAVRVEDSTTGMINISGKSLAGKSTKRIVYPPYSTNSVRPEVIAYDLLNRNMITSTSDRQLKYLTLGATPNFGTNAIPYQNSYGVLSEEVNQLCTAYELCFREVPINLENPIAQIEFYKGRDLSGIGGVEFNLKFENMTSECFEHSIADWATAAYVFGEGEGANRKSVIVTQDISTGRPQGLDINEIYVDARDLQQTFQNDAGQQVTLTDEQYRAQLIQRGEQSLAQRPLILNINGDIDTKSQLFKFKKDYDLGDRVRQTSDLFGLTKTAILTEMQETWDADGHHLTPTFDKESPTIFDILKRRN
ncbi:MAG TPA: hypothetical protein DCZ00_00670 [Lactococcus sp.]|uniref:siphovirus ReqiPepy6 Gp37-like family protein n=1 Tax=Lactococcus TaxID=1357 RepID=UPI000E9F0A4B|nr:MULTISPECIES: siphovirus ReqiPepy6 Gp37-like family protein [Lactococcus]HBC89940.1 hypothetical protein [Lactococcus sp.]